VENSQSGTPKIDAKAISDFRKIVIPMIRRVLPSLIAQDIVGVQPMGLGPPVCEHCFVLGTLDEKRTTHPWACHICSDTKLNGSLWTYSKDLQTLIQARSNAFKNYIPKMLKATAFIHRPFMYPGNPAEPNDRYRPWLEEHVGVQGEDWNWSLAPGKDFNILEIEFLKKEHAMLFELTCP
jgi:hypothetical protein